MSTETFTILAHSRSYGGTHIARCNGKQASCTESHRAAAIAAAKKAFGTRVVNIWELPVFRSTGRETFHVVVKEQELKTP